MTGKVSVVIPAYNAERFIGEALKSVFDQTYPPYEVIVIDDGSRDRTAEIVAQFGARVIFERQQNQGASAARNRGVELAKGEWIAFLDADDLWYPERLEVQLRYAEQNPNVRFIYSDFAVIDEDGRLVETDWLSKKWNAERQKRNANLDLVALAFNNQPFPYPSTVLIAKDLFIRAGGFNRAFRGNYHEDFEAFARIARLSPPHFLPQSLVKYRQPSGVPRGESRDYNYWLLLKCLYDMWQEEPLKLNAVRDHLAHFMGKKGREYLCSRDYKTARKYFDLALRYKPSSWPIQRRKLVSYIPGIRSFYAFWQTRIRGKPKARAEQDFLLSEVVKQPGMLNVKSTLDAKSTVKS